MKTTKIGAKVKTIAEQGKLRVQKAVRKVGQKAAQGAAPKVTHSSKKPHPGTDPRQPDDRDGNEGFHRARPPTPDEPIRKAPRKASPGKATPGRIS